MHFCIGPCTGSRSLGSNRTKIVNAGISRAAAGAAYPKSKIDMGSRTCGHVGIVVGLVKMLVDKTKLRRQHQRPEHRNDRD